MSQNPSIIFNPDHSRLVLDPLTNRLITAGELARRTAQPPSSKPVIAPAVIAKPKEIPVTVAKPIEKPKVEVKPVATPSKPSAPLVKPAAKPVAAPSKPSAPLVKPAAKPVAKTVKFDISASLNVPPPRYKGPLVIPHKGGYGAVSLDRGRR